MPYVNLTSEERRVIIESILESDKRYLERLLQKKYNLLLEFELLEHSINKKQAEIDVMQLQLSFVDTYC